MKETAVFLNEREQNELARAYGSETRESLRRSLDLPEQVILPETMEENRDLLARTSYVFSTWGMPALTEEQIADYLPNLKAVFYAAGSVQGFARPFLHRGVKVFSAWAANAVPVAEFTVAQIVLAGKGYFQGMRRLEPGSMKRFRAFSDTFPCNYGVRIGILGAGMIGSLVLEMLRRYDVETLVYDPFAGEEKIAALGARRASLEEIFSQCQVISNHIANLPATQRMLRYEHFSRMKPNGVFINTGRGAQVVEEDLVRALREEPDRTALLDVTWPEPPEADSPLWTMPNVILSPHIAGSMNNEIARMGAYMQREYEAFSEGRPCSWEVTLKRLETMA